MSRRKTVLFFCTILLLCPLFSSCLKWILPTKWDKDYYSYEMGAMINGEEYHNVRLYSISSLGLDLMRTGDGFVYLKTCYNESYLSNPKGKEFKLTILAAIDSTAFIYGGSYDLSDHVSGHDVDVLSDEAIYFVPDHGIYEKDSYEKLVSSPYCICAFYTDINKANSYYLSKDGHIILSDFNERSYPGEKMVFGESTGMVKFECTAVNNKGDTLHVTNGYIKYR